MTSSSTNHAWLIASPSHLVQTQPGQLPKPTPGPKQILLRISAACLNYRDLLVLQHSPAYPVVAKPNLVPCSDSAGIIEAAGPDSVWASSVGATVSAHPNTWIAGDVENYSIAHTYGGGNVDGTLQRYVVVDDERVKRAPKNLSAVESAALGTAGLTAWNGLFGGPVRVKEGETVLTLGTGGVSCFGIQLAAAAGATVIATSSSDEKLEFAKTLGVAHVINYLKTPNWADEVLRITNGRGVDRVLEVGGSSTIEQSLRATRQGGHIALLGILSASKQADLIPAIMFGAKTVRGVLGSGSKEMQDEMTEFLEKHDIHPVISKVYEFDEAPQAFAELEKQSAIGKIVIKV